MDHYDVLCPAQRQNRGSGKYPGREGAREPIAPAASCGGLPATKSGGRSANRSACAAKEKSARRAGQKRRWRAHARPTREKVSVERGSASGSLKAGRGNASNEAVHRGGLQRPGNTQRDKGTRGGGFGEDAFDLQLICIVPKALCPNAYISRRLTKPAPVSQQRRHGWCSATAPKLKPPSSNGNQRQKPVMRRQISSRPGT